MTQQCYDKDFDIDFDVEQATRLAIQNDVKKRKSKTIQYMKIHCCSH